MSNTSEELQTGTDELDLEAHENEVNLEELADGQGITETGASIGYFGCCSYCGS